MLSLLWMIETAAALAIQTAPVAFQYSSMTIVSGDTITLQVDRGDGACDCCASSHLLTVEGVQGTTGVYPEWPYIPSTSLVQFMGPTGNYFYLAPCGSLMKFTMQLPAPMGMEPYYIMTLKDTRTFQSYDGASPYACKYQKEFGQIVAYGSSPGMPTYSCCPSSYFQYKANETYTATIDILVLNSLVPPLARNQTLAPLVPGECPTPVCPTTTAAPVSAPVSAPAPVPMQNFTASNKTTTSVAAAGKPALSKAATDAIIAGIVIVPGGAFVGLAGMAIHGLYKKRRLETYSV